LITKHIELIRACQNYFGSKFALEILSCYSDNVLQPKSFVIFDTSVLNDPIGFIASHRVNIFTHLVYIIPGNLDLDLIPDNCVDNECLISYPCGTTYIYQFLDRYFEVLQKSRIKKSDIFYDDFDLPESFNNKLVGNSKVIKNVRKQLMKAAENDENVLLLGETGTGKSCAAEIIHRKSKRSEFEMVSVFCERIKEELDYSTLFGAVKGSFTNAIQDIEGYVERADKGILFFDEFGCLPLSTQALFITFVENKVYAQMGKTTNKQLDTRMIFATNINMLESINNKQFRSDVYFRINKNEIVLPSLNQRLEDIPMIVDEYVKTENKKRAEHGEGKFYVDDRVYPLLQEHYWKGNLRELNTVMENGLRNCYHNYITVDDIQFGVLAGNQEDF